MWTMEQYRKGSGQYYLQQHMRIQQNRTHLLQSILQTMTIHAFCLPSSLTYLRVKILFKKNWHFSNYFCRKFKMQAKNYMDRKVPICIKMLAPQNSLDGVSALVNQILRPVQTAAVLMKAIAKNIAARKHNIFRRNFHLGFPIFTTIFLLVLRPCSQSWSGSDVHHTRRTLKRCSNIYKEEKYIITKGENIVNFWINLINFLSAFLDIYIII